jgi:hypothetical protein
MTLVASGRMIDIFVPIPSNPCLVYRVILKLAWERVRDGYIGTLIQKARRQRREWKTRVGWRACLSWLQDLAQHAGTDVRNGPLAKSTPENWERLVISQSFIKAKKIKQHTVSSHSHKTHLSKAGTMAHKIGRIRMVIGFEDNKTYKRISRFCLQSLHIMY